LHTFGPENFSLSKLQIYGDLIYWSMTVINLIRFKTYQNKIKDAKEKTHCISTVGLDLQLFSKSTTSLR